MKGPPNPRDIAAEIIRRTGGESGSCRGYVVRLSDPPTAREQLQLLAARLERRQIVIMPHRCKTTDGWLERYGSSHDHQQSG